MTAVIQDWVTKLPWQMQSALLTSIRKPETVLCPQIKSITRWIRANVQHNADSERAYMTWAAPKVDRGALKKELEYVTMHHFFHFVEALEIISYFGHDEETPHPVPDRYPPMPVGNQRTKIATYWYVTIVREFCHQHPETREELRARLCKGGEGD